LSSGLFLVIDRRSKGRMMILGAGRFALTTGIEDTAVRTWNSWEVLLNCHSLYIDGTSNKVSNVGPFDYWQSYARLVGSHDW